MSTSQASRSAASITSSSFLLSSTVTEGFSSTTTFATRTATTTITTTTTTTCITSSPDRTSPWYTRSKCSSGSCCHRILLRLEAGPQPLLPEFAMPSYCFLEWETVQDDEDDCDDTFA